MNVENSQLFVSIAGLGVHHHLIANSEASLLRISSHHHHNGDRRSFVPRIPPLGRSGSNSEKYGSESKMNTFFDKYRDCDEAILGKSHIF